MSAFELTWTGQVPIVRLVDDVDASNAGPLREELSRRLGFDVDLLVIDLSQIRYVDSAGLDMLFRLGDQLRQRRARLAVVIPGGSQLTRLAAIVGLAGAVGLYETIQDAVESCRAGGGGGGMGAWGAGGRGGRVESAPIYDRP